MVVIIINNIHKVFEQLSYRIRSEIQSVSSEFELYEKIQEESAFSSMSLSLQHLHFLCDMYNRRELFLSRQIAEAVFSNQDQLVQLKRSNPIYFIRDSHWEYSRQNYLSTIDTKKNKKNNVR